MTINSFEENVMSTEALPNPDWKTWVLAWEKSDLSQKKYCQENALSYSRFVYERNRLIKQNQPSSTGEFLAVKNQAERASTQAHPHLGASSGFVLRCPNGYQLAIPAGADAPTLNRLLSFLGR